ncbi:hypothetical protein [Paracoccus sp. IB05]|uniref:hypothetical protein n=1 Tax=Paracoccus sp. IB05 TaxID=2779367 RepID=UPI0018E76070|nr:hypothetical protein [Paracoccus sp. IB05]MBJ2149713.1 hypothetical protein [Paracoccus sp. IB05]
MGEEPEADMALMSIVDFYCPNNDQCRRIVCASALGKREKATRDDRYLPLTLEPIRRRQAAEAQRIAFKQASDGAGRGIAAMPPVHGHQGDAPRPRLYRCRKADDPLPRQPRLAVAPPGISAPLRHNTTNIITPEGVPATSTFGI